MRYLKTYQLFEATTTSGLTPEQEEFLNKCTKGSWTYNSSTGLVDVDGDFRCSDQNLDDFKGVRFGKVSGNFNCQYNRLTSLEGSPRQVGGDFNCSDNDLTSLEGAPEWIKMYGSFNCRYNKLTSLEGAPPKVGWSFFCDSNRLTSLVGAPTKLGGRFSCEGNNLTSLEGAPQKVGDGFICDAFSRLGDEWNPKVWLQILKEGSPEARRLISTLLTPEFLNQEIAKDPEGMIMKLKPVWNDESFRETRDKLVWPRGYEQEADLLGDLDDVGF